MFKFSKEQKKQLGKFVRYVVGPVLFIWLSWSIYVQVSEQPGIDASWQKIRRSFDTSGTLVFALLFVLMLLNWGIEALKWQLSVKKIQDVSFGKAFRAVLSGVSFSVSTPNRVGEYLGRILYMDDGNRLKAISLTIVGSISQLLVTVTMGLISLLALRSKLEAGGIISSFWLGMILYGTSIVLLLLTLFYFRLPLLITWIDRLPGVKKFAWLLETLESFHATLLFRLLSLSVLRFFVFMLQYYLLFRLFEVQVSWWEVVSAISVMFLVMAALPTIALFTDLGLKGEVSLKLLGIFSSNQLGISLTTLSIWLINLVIPALAGSLLILGIKKIFTSRNERS